MTRHYFRSIRKDAKRKRAAKARSAAARELRREYGREKPGVSYGEFRKEKAADRLYEDYSKAYDKLRGEYKGAAIDKWSRREFGAFLEGASRKKMAPGRFITRSVSTQIGVMPRSEAISLRAQLANAAREAGDEDYARTVDSMRIGEVRNNPVLQKTLYNYLRRSGMTAAETRDWWTPNIIGSD